MGELFSKEGQKSRADELRETEMRPPGSQSNEEVMDVAPDGRAVIYLWSCSAFLEKALPSFF